MQTCDLQLCIQRKNRQRRLCSDDETEEIYLSTKHVSHAIQITPRRSSCCVMCQTVECYSPISLVIPGQISAEIPLTTLCMVCKDKIMGGKTKICGILDVPNNIHSCWFGFQVLPPYFVNKTMLTVIVQGE